MSLIIETGAGTSTEANAKSDNVVDAQFEEVK